MHHCTKITGRFSKTSNVVVVVVVVVAGSLLALYLPPPIQTWSSQWPPTLTTEWSISTWAAWIWPTAPWSRPSSGSSEPPTPRPRPWSSEWSCTRWTAAWHHSGQSHGWTLPSMQISMGVLFNCWSSLNILAEPRYFLFHYNYGVIVITEGAEPAVVFLSASQRNLNHSSLSIFTRLTDFFLKHFFLCCIIVHTSGHQEKNIVRFQLVPLALACTIWGRL